MIQIREELESKGCQIQTGCEVQSVSTIDCGGKKLFSTDHQGTIQEI